MNDGKAPTRSTFFRRVEIERATLRTVNALLKTPVALQGVSPSAVEAWRTANSIQPRAVDRLLELSALLARMADQSRAVFDVEAVPEDEIEEAMLNLKSALEPKVG